MESRANYESPTTKDGVDIDSLKQYMVKAFENTQAAKEKEIVLVIGNTGSGKSTTINYLLENPLATKQDEYGIDYIDVADPNTQQHYPKIGQSSTVSETLYPEVYRAPSGLDICDCPGFGDTRGEVEAITAAVSTKAVIKNARSIRAIVVLLGFPFDGDKCLTLRNSFSTLQILLSQSHGSNQNAVDSQQLMSSIIFLASKTSHNGKSIRLFNKILAEVENNPHFEEADTIKFMCNLILKNPANYIEVNPLDQGQTRSMILERLRISQPLPGSTFGIPADANTKQVLISMVSEITLFGIGILKALLNLPAEHAKIEGLRALDLAQMETLERKLYDLENNVDSTEPEQGFETIANLISNVKSRIDKKNDELISLVNDIEILDSKLSELNTSDLIEYWRQVYDEKKIFGVVSQYVRNTHTFVYEGTPFDKAMFESHGEGSVFNVLENSPVNGRYRVKYTTGPLFYGTGIAVIHGEKCNKPEIMKEVESLKSALESRNRSVEQLRGDIATLEQHQNKLEDKIVELEKVKNKSAQDYKNLLVQTILKDKSACEERLISMEQQLQAISEKYFRAQQQYPEYKPAIDVVRQITELIDGLNNSKVDELLSLTQLVDAEPDPGFVPVAAVRNRNAFFAQAGHHENVAFTDCAEYYIRPSAPPL